MCGRFAVDNSVNNLVLDFVADGGDPADWLEAWHANWNIKPTQNIPVLFESVKGEGPVKRRAELGRWSLLPIWAKTEKLKFPTFNARSKSAAGKPTWKTAVKAKRAVIPALGYYEWRTVGKTKTPFFIHSDDGEPLLFAGLYSWWRPPASNDDDDWQLTATIMTRAAVGPVADLHDRTPVTLPEGFVSHWVDAGVVGDQGLVDEAVAAATPVAEALEFYEVAPLKGDGPELVQPLKGT